MVNNILKFVFSLIILILGFLVYRSIMIPLHFTQEVNKRSEEIEERLKKLRTAEFLFKQIHERYTANFDSLARFMETGKIPVVRMISDPRDTTYTLTIIDTIGYITVADSLFGKDRKYGLTDLQFIPYSGKSKFIMEAGSIDKSGIKVPVFMISAYYDDFLKDLDKQSVLNLKTKSIENDMFPGLKVGSMNEATTKGNWE